MTPLFYKVLKRQDQIKLDRLNRLLKEGSPHYRWNVTAIAAAAFDEFDISRTYPLARKYEPLDTMLIINNDAVNIEVNLNGMADAGYIIPAGTIRKISPAECGAFRKVRITNLDALAAVTVDLIDIDMWRSPADADSVARGQY